MKARFPQYLSRGGNPRFVVMKGETNERADRMAEKLSTAELPVVRLTGWRRASAWLGEPIGPRWICSWLVGVALVRLAASIGGWLS